MLCGTDPFPEKYRAKKYKIHQKFLSREEFRFIMRSHVMATSEQGLITLNYRPQIKKKADPHLNLILFTRTCFRLNLSSVEGDISLV